MHQQNYNAKPFLQFAYDAFAAIVFIPRQDSICKLLLEYMNKDRAGEAIDKLMLKNAANV